MVKRAHDAVAAILNDNDSEQSDAEEWEKEFIHFLYSSPSMQRCKAYMDFENKVRLITEDILVFGMIEMYEVAS